MVRAAIKEARARGLCLAQEVYTCGKKLAIEGDYECRIYCKSGTLAVRTNGSVLLKNTIFSEHFRYLSTKNSLMRTISFVTKAKASL